MKRKATHFIRNWKNVISLTFIVFSFGNFIAQTNLTPPIVCSGADTVGTVGTGPFDPGQPSGPVYNGPVASTVTCTPVGNDYIHDYQLIKHYKNYDNQPVKTLQIALHIFRDNYGNFIDDRNTPSTLDDTLIWQQDDSTDAYIQKFEGWINEIYGQLAHSSEVYASPIFYLDSKIRVN